MKNRYSLLISLLIFHFSSAQHTPEITSWIIQLNGQTGYNGLPANVQSVSYTTTDVYITCSCIPGYDVGPWVGNPNTPANQNFCFKITRNPQENAGTKTATGLGHVGVWSNGVSIFNAKDAFSYNNQGVWNQDALPNEGSSFDACLGHPAPNGEYHHHVNPTCLYDDENATQHAPILGYAFDGFPVYGAYAYANTNGTGPIARMRTGYRLRNITTRTTLPNGSAAPFPGPNVSAQYPLGKYLEDYEYVQGLGDLDEHNGRFCITPDYPNGIYAYFVTIDSNQTPVYPYTIGPTYYGMVQSGNTGPQSGHNAVPGNATPYMPVTGTIETVPVKWVEIFPNPSNEFIYINSQANFERLSFELFDGKGSMVLRTDFSTATTRIDISALPQGLYFYRIKSESAREWKGKLNKVSM